MLRRREFIRIAGLSGLGLYVESALPAFGKLIADHPGDIENLNRALNIAESIEDIAYRARATCRVAGGFYNKGKKEFSDAMAIKALKMSFQAGKGKDLALKAVGEYYLKAGNIKKALRIISLMDRQGMMKHHLFLKASYFAYKKGDIALSDRLLSMIESSSAPVYLNPSKLDQNQEITLLNWLERLYQRCRKANYSDYLACAFFRRGDSKKGLRYLEELWLRCPPEAVRIAISYLPEEGIRAIENRIFSLDNKLDRVESLLGLSEYYIKTEPDRAKILIEKIMAIISDEYLPSAYAKAGSLLVRAGDSVNGRKYLSSVLEWMKYNFVDTPKEDLPFIYSHYLEELIVEYIVAGLQDEIPRLLHALDSNAIQYREPLWYSGIVIGSEEAGCRDNALLFLEKEIKRVSMKELPERVNCLSELASTFLLQNEREKGIQVTMNVINDLDAVLSDNNLRTRIDFAYLSTAPYLKDSEKIFLEAVPKLALELARQGLYGEAKTLADMVCNPELDDEIYYHTACHLSGRGGFNEALRITKEIRDTKTRGLAIYKIVSKIVDLNIKSV